MTKRRRRPADPKIAVAYLRCSTTTERQALGIEAQRDAVAAWAAREGVSIVAWYTEEVSGGASLDRRPVLLEALAAVAAHGAGRLVVHRLDRFSREPLTAALAERELQAHGAALACADGVGQGDDPASELVRGILVAVHRFDRAMIKARIKSALAVKQRRGEMTGAPRFGYRLAADGVHTEPDPTEQAAIARICELRAQGMAIRPIAEALEAQGFVGRTGKALSRDTVHNVLKSLT